MTGIPYEQALAAWRMSSPVVARDNPLPREDLLARYHPDYRAETRTTIKVGPIGCTRMRALTKPLSLAQR